MVFRVLFVCTGNICRSPLAEAVLRHKLDLAGLAHAVMVDSAGTHGYHVGERPDPRTLRVAELNGIPTDGLRARQVNAKDFEEFDLILGMDEGHVSLLRERAGHTYLSKIRLFLEYSGGERRDVPDPYYGDFSGFEEMYRLIDAATENLRIFINQ